VVRFYPVVVVYYPLQERLNSMFPFQTHSPLPVQLEVEGMWMKVEE
jgi:hypothetical protein